MILLFYCASAPRHRPSWMGIPRLAIQACLGLSLIFATANVGHANLVTITNVTTSMGTFSTNYEPEFMINGAGLNASNEHTNDSPLVHWASQSGQLSGQVTFTLDSEQLIDSMHIWNYNESSFAHWGIRNFEILGSTNGTDFFSITSVTDLAQAPTTPTYLGEQIDLPNFSASHVRFNITSPWGASGSGISEVQFNSVAVPEPRGMALLLFACLGLILLIKQSRKLGKVARSDPAA